LIFGTPEANVFSQRILPDLSGNDDMMHYAGGCSLPKSCKILLLIPIMPTGALLFR
jgi:hypothetical protein